MVGEGGGGRAASLHQNKFNPVTLLQMQFSASTLSSCEQLELTPPQPVFTFGSANCVNDQIFIRSRPEFVSKRDKQSHLDKIHNSLHRFAIKYSNVFI